MSILGLWLPSPRALQPSLQIAVGPHQLGQFLLQNCHFLLGLPLFHFHLHLLLRQFLQIPQVLLKGASLGTTQTGLLLCIAFIQFQTHQFLPQLLILLYQPVYFRVYGRQEGVLQVWLRREYFLSCLRPSRILGGPTILGNQHQPPILLIQVLYLRLHLVHPSVMLAPSQLLDRALLQGNLLLQFRHDLFQSEAQSHVLYLNIVLHHHAPDLPVLDHFLFISEPFSYIHSMHTHKRSYLAAVKLRDSTDRSVDVSVNIFKDCIYELDQRSAMDLSRNAKYSIVGAKQCESYLKRLAKQSRNERAERRGNIRASEKGEFKRSATNAESNVLRSFIASKANKSSLKESRGSHDATSISLMQSKLENYRRVWRNQVELSAGIVPKMHSIYRTIDGQRSKVERRMQTEASSSHWEHTLRDQNIHEKERIGQNRFRVTRALLLKGRDKFQKETEALKESRLEGAKRNQSDLK